MTDPLRSDPLPTGGDVPERERDARVEELLLTGLDHYFLGQHELAVSVWTRVLFLDRGHARARAYIERARSALAERQRETEELLHTGAAAFHRGDAGAARRLLTSAVERGAASEEAIVLLERLNRLENASPANVPNGLDDRRRNTSDAPVPGDVAPERVSRLAWIAAGVCAGLAVAAMAVWLWIGAGAPWTREQPDRRPSTVQTEPERLPIPSSAEAALTRAERLHSSGRLHDAMEVLESVRQGDPLRPRADALRATIQKQLLDAAHAIRPQ